MKKILAILMLSINALATTLTGNFKNPDGTGITGYLYLSVTQQASVSGCASPFNGTFQVVPTNQVRYSITNGVLQGSPAVVGNDCMSPSGVQYYATVKDTNGNTLFSDTWQITGSSADLGTIQDTGSNVGVAVINPVLLNPASNQTVVQSPGTALAVSGTGTVFNVTGGQSSFNKTVNLSGSGTSSIQGLNSSTTTTVPSTVDVSNEGISIAHTINASSATNDLVERGLQIALTNTLSGGGHVQNSRTLEINMGGTNGGTTTDSDVGIFIINPTQAGTVGVGYGIYIASIPGATAYSIYDVSPGNWYSGQGIIAHNGSTLITANPANVSASNVGWKDCYYANVYCSGVANSTMAFSIPQFFSLFVNGTNPNNNASTPAPDTNAVLSFNAGTGGAMTQKGLAFASLGAPPNGTFIYCPDCTIASPCASGGSGALAKRLNGVWVCN